MLAVWLLLSKWPQRWRWTREVCDSCKTWLWVTRTWAAIVLAVAIPAALARVRPPENEPAPRLAQAVQFAPVLAEVAAPSPRPAQTIQFAPVLDGVAAPPQQDLSESYPKEHRYDDEWTTDSREPLLAQRPAPTAPVHHHPGDATIGPEPAPWVPQYENRPDENTPRYEAPQYDRHERKCYQREYGPSGRRSAPRSAYAPRREYGRLEGSLGDGLASLGERLFFETKLSRSGNTACATCHRPEHAFPDVGRTSQADDGKPGRRNAPSLINSVALPSLL